MRIYSEARCRMVRGKGFKVVAIDEFPLCLLQIFVFTSLQRDGQHNVHLVASFGLGRG